MTAPAELEGTTVTSDVPCPCCNGAGEISYEPMDWWHGSGVNTVVVESPCSFCRGEGVFTVAEDGS